MEGFSRAYRDPQSPLAPLTPLSANSAFNFEVGGEESLKHWLAKINAAIQLTPSSCALQNHLTPNLPKVNSSSYANLSGKVSSSTKYRDYKGGQAANTPRSSKNYRTQEGSTNTPRSCKNQTNTKNIRFYTPSSTNYGNKAKNQYNADKIASGAPCNAKQPNNNPINKPKTAPSVGCGCLRPPKIVINQEKSPKESQSSTASFLQWLYDCFSQGALSMGDRLHALLTHFGLEKYWPLLEREEIDMEVFRTLTQDDLKTLGIKNGDDCKSFIEAVKLAHKMK